MKTSVLLGKDGQQKTSLRLTNIGPHGVNAGTLSSKHEMLLSSPGGMASSDDLNSPDYRLKKPAMGFETEDSLMLPMVSSND